MMMYIRKTNVILIFLWPLNLVSTSSLSPYHFLSGAENAKFAKTNMERRREECPIWLSYNHHIYGTSQGGWIDAIIEALQALYHATNKTKAHLHC